MPLALDELRGQERDFQRLLREPPAAILGGLIDNDIDPLSPETDAAEGFELPGADLSGEELTVQVLPRQQDEFTCTSCFLVKHRSQLHTAQSDSDGQLICNDCAD